MNDTTRAKQSDLQGLPAVTYRQLEVFREVCREGSYANAAHELHCTRTNVKRVCGEFEKAVGRRLFVEGADRTVAPTDFARSLLGHVSPLSRALRRLDECVRALHDNGRILRFAADGEFFKGGLFTDFLARLQISDRFRPCFLRIEMKRFRTALLNAECDVYFGVGIQPSDRLDLVPLGPIPWHIRVGRHYGGKQPASPVDLPSGKWWIACAGESAATQALLEGFHRAGARDGRIHPEPAAFADENGILFTHDITAKQIHDGQWPCFQFAAVLRKHHPYTELVPRLTGAALH